MIISKKSLIGMSVALLTTSSAFAQLHVPYGLYVGAAVGESNYDVNQLDVFAHVATNTYKLPASGFSVFKPVYMVDVGYAHPSWPVRFEVQYQYHNNLNKTFSITTPAVVSADIRLSSQVFMLNTYFDWLNKYSTFMPYFLVGVGVSNNVTNWTYHATGSGSGKDHNISFAWQLGVGSRIRVMDNLFVDVGAQLVNLGRVICKTGDSGNGINAKANKLISVQGTLGLHFFFGDQSKRPPGLINDDVD